MDLDQLEALVAIADHGSITAAAAQLHVTQPALSRRISALEGTLGATVLERVGRGVRLTSAGHVAVEAGRRMMRERRQLAASLDELRNLERGEIKIAGLPSMIATHLVEPIAAFRAEHPGIELFVSGAVDSAQLIASVASARCDVGIVDLPVDSPRLQTFSLGAQELMGVFPPGTVVRTTSDHHHRTVTRAELRNHPLVALPPNTSSRGLVDDLFAGAHPPTIGVTTDLRDLIVPLVLAGAGAAVVPDRLAAAAVQSGAIVARIQPRIRREVGLVARDGQLPAAVRRFVEITGAAT